MADVKSLLLLIRNSDEEFREITVNLLLGQLTTSTTNGNGPCVKE